MTYPFGRCMTLLGAVVAVLAASPVKAQTSSQPPRSGALQSVEPTIGVAGQILGVDTGLPLPFAVVWATQTSRQTSDPPKILGANAGKDGRFSFLATVGQTYSLCVTASGYLDPCRWSSEPVVVSSDANVFVQVRLDHGVPLQVVLRYDDTLQSEIRAADPGSVVAPLPPVGVFFTTNSGREVPIPRMASSGASAYYNDLVPANPEGFVSLRTNQVRLNDDKGKPYIVGSPVGIPSGGAAPIGLTLGGPATSLPAGMRSLAFTVHSLE